MNRYTSRFKSVKVFLCFAVFLLVAKPFLGFSMFSRTHPPSRRSIFVKAYTKRKQEYTEGSKFSIESIQKKLSEPADQLRLRFIAFLSILFPFAFCKIISVTNGLIKQYNLSSAFCETSYQRTSILII
jgi:hypothetical protein